MLSTVDTAGEVLKLLYPKSRMPGMLVLGSLEVTS